MNDRILLVRHPPVARAWDGRCYGRSDMGWSRAGTTMARQLAEKLAAEPATLIVHSGALRTERLAEMIGKHHDVPLRRDDRWLERDFGTWEGRSWHAIWRETGDLMDRMITDPHVFRPGGGETTAELSSRACAAFHDLPRAGPIIVIAHGGPIAAVRSQSAATGVEGIVNFIPAYGLVVECSSRELSSDGSHTGILPCC